MQHIHTLIVGAGVSGLSAARLLKEQGFETLILEKSSKPGGLIKCDVVDGHLFHRVGGHVFNTRLATVAEWFWSQFNQETSFLKATRHAGILMEDQFLGYPFENYLYQLDEAVVRKVVHELMDLEKNQPQQGYADFESFLKGNFGSLLYELYFKPYNYKLWKTDLSQVALPWLDGKLPMPNYREIILSNILRKEEKDMVHSSFFYPRLNGSQFIADRLADTLSIVYDESVVSIERKSNQWVVNGTYACENLVYTGDVRQLSQCIHNVSDQVNGCLKSITGLRSNGTSNLLCETDDMPYSWLYLPDASISAHRIIYTGNFSPSNQPAGVRRSCTVEFSGKASMELMLKTLEKLPGNLKMIDSNYEPNSYVIQYNGDREKLQAVKNMLQPMGLYLCGRFAEWEYHNMDKAIESAMQVVSQIRNQ